MMKKKFSVVLLMLIMMTLGQVESSFAGRRNNLSITKLSAMVYLMCGTSALLEGVNATGCHRYEYTDCTPQINGFVNTTTGRIDGTINYNGCKMRCEYSGECFPGDAKVQILKEVGKTQEIPMSELRVGDQVVIGYDQNGTEVTEKVVDFFHREPQVEQQYLSIQMRQIDAPLLISSKHLVKKAGENEPEFALAYDPSDHQNWVSAEQIQAGDRIYYNGVPTLVERVEAQILKGLYAPLTEKTCTIQVNGVGCSCFSEVKSQRLGKLYAKWIRPFFVTPLKAEDCSDSHYHPVGKFDSISYQAQKWITGSGTKGGI